MITSAVTALEVADEAFLIASLIERCPKSMMIRELMMNALEAAQHVPEGRRLGRDQFHAYGWCRQAGDLEYRPGHG